MSRSALDAVVWWLGGSADATGPPLAPWDAVLALANDHLLTPALHAAVRDRGATAHAPPEVLAYLSHLAAANDARCARLREQAWDVARTLNRAGVTPVFLKSSADLLAGDGALSRDGIVGDLDVLVPEDAAHDAARALTATGYRAADGLAPNDHTYADLARPGCAAMVDLHTATLENSDLLTPAEMWADAVDCREGDATYCIPSATDRLRHRVLHDQVQERGLLTGRIRLDSAWRIARLAESRTIDWPRARHGFSAARLGWVLDTEARAAAMFGAAVPVPASRRAKLLHGWRLLRLAYPKIRVPAGWLARAIDQTIRLHTTRGAGVVDT